LLRVRPDRPSQALGPDHGSDRQPLTVLLGTDDSAARDASHRENTLTSEGGPVTDKPFTTCLWFDTEGEEAASYYTSIFKNSKIGNVGRYTEAGPGPAGTVMAVEFALNGQKFVALNGGPEFKFNEAISFQIFCADQDEVDYYWSKLSEGGEEGPCGWLKDKYGLSWQVVPTALMEMIADPDPEKAKRATEAMLAMSKFDIAALEKAYAGE
jgi:predicted 3-demethylubiquinone-9 3-methyltransferase (glyoxalase superfamily)